MVNIRKSIKEFFSSGLRTYGGLFSNQSILMANRPILDNSKINMDKARSLYSNIDNTKCLGASFCKPIIDLQVNFIGIPKVNTENDATDDFLNSCIEEYWSEGLLEVYRNVLRDSESWVRIRKPFPSVLLSEEEASKTYIEVVDPDRVTFYNDPLTSLLQRVEITHDIWVEIEDFFPEQLANYLKARTEKQTIIEIIDKDSFQYFNKTKNILMTELTEINEWGFVPLIRVFNEYDSTIGSGQSDLEVVYPFLQAYHNILEQSMASNKYHSDPKVYFKLDDIAPFLSHNFPDSFNNETGQFSGKIEWSGKEIFFLESTDEVGLLEAKSVLGDSVTLLQFIFDCICVASQTPEWAFMRVQGSVSVGATTPQTLPFENKIKRKRQSFSSFIQELCKMSMVIYGLEPIKPALSWPAIQVENSQTEANTLQLTVAGLEVANRAGIISKQTYRKKLREFIPQIQDNELEQSQIEKENKIDQANEVSQTEALAKAKAAGTPTPTGSGPNSVEDRTSRVPQDIPPSQQ